MGGTLTWGAVSSVDSSTTGLPEWKASMTQKNFQTRCWVLRERERFLGPGHYD